MASRKRRYTLDEYSALKTAYGKPYTRKDMFITLLKPFLFISIFTYLVCYYWWLSLIYGVLAVIYQYRRINTLNVKREYEEKAFNERNKFINNLTQILTNPTTTTLDGLIDVKDRTEGEFNNDITVLLTRLSDSTPAKIHDAFEKFKSRYQRDVVFIQYVDQIETALIDGRNNIEILKDIRSFHNEVKKKRDYFLRLKQTRTKNFKVIIGILLAAIIAMTVSMGASKYIDSYAHSPIGWISNTLFLGGIFLIFRSHLKKQEDDEVMEIQL